MTTQLEKSSRESTASNPAGDKRAPPSIAKERIAIKNDFVESSSETTASNPTGDAFKEGGLKKRWTSKNTSGSGSGSGSADDFPTDEIAATAHEIKQEINQTTSNTKRTLHNSLKRFRAALHRKLRQSRGVLIRLRHKIRYNPFISKQISTSKHLWADLMSQSRPVKALLFAILLTNLIIPMFFLDRSEGAVVFGTYILVSLISHVLYQNTSSPDKLRSIALSHIVWVPMLFWLLSRSANPNEKVTDSISMDHVRVSVTLLVKRSWLFTLWIRSVLLINSFALSVDALQMAQLFQEKTGRNLGVPNQPGTIAEPKTVEEKSKQQAPKFNQQTLFRQKDVKEIHHAAPTA